MQRSLAENVFFSWVFEPLPAIVLIVGSILYFRGWRKMHAQLPERFPVWRLGSFLAGCGVIYAALASPLDAFASWLLTVHMVQHLLLTMLAPPLLLMGWPLLPVLLGLPRGFAREGLAPFMNDPILKKVGAFLVHPLFAGPLFMISNVLWHAPFFYELALGSRFWHQLEHIVFLTTATLFWWSVIQPWPSRPAWPRWSVIPYLLVADLQNTALSGFFTFYGKVLYPTYANAPRVVNLSPLEDQTAAGAFMWVAGSLAFLIPAGGVAIRYLSPTRLHRSKKLTPPKKNAPARKHFDLLEMPLVGPLMRWKHFRRSLQILLFALAGLIVLDGLFGPQVAAMNFAGVLPWTHWRTFTVVALLVAGNFFCMACPFTLARDVARKFLPRGQNWPRSLRSKWLSVALLGLFFWAYEFFDLWATPWWTAWIIVFYFFAAIVVDGFFRGASFCKFICPIGQFHFVSSLSSPLEVRVREPEVCAGCKTHDCLRGNETQRGCELQLFQPLKSGNMDCTFCLDCVNACPSGNVGILAVSPGTDLLNSNRRSSIGKYSKRPDIAALALVFTIGAFVNAAGMVSGIPSFAWIGVELLGAIFASVLVMKNPWREKVADFSMTLVPLGFAMWIAHFLFHFLTGVLAPWPVIQRVMNDIGLSNSAPCWNVPTIVFPDFTGLQILILNAGCLFSLWLLWQKSRNTDSRWRIFLPWATLAIILFASGVWLILQPMEMRGTLLN